MALSAALSVFAAKCSAYGSEHADAGVCAHTAYKKYVYPCGHTWVMRERGVGNSLVVFTLHFLEDQLVFTFLAV